MSGAPYLCFKEIKLDSIPSAGSPEYKSFIETIYAEADALLVGTEDENKHADWKITKALENGTVAMRCRNARKDAPDNGLKWHGRTSYHESPAFETFKEFMQDKRSESVSEYMSSMENLVGLATFDDGKIEAFYTVISLGAIGAKREFAGIAINRSYDGEKRFTVITVPVSTTETQGGVKGLYCAVEDVREIQRYGKTLVQWRKVQLSSPRGSIPSFLAEKQIEPTMSKDVTDFLNFLKKKNIPGSVEFVG